MISGKRKEIKKGKKLLDREKYPIHLVIPEMSVKLSLDLNKEGNEFSLFVNARNVYALPYFYEFNSSTDDEISLQVSEIKLNGEQIDLPQPWTPVDFINNIRLILERLPKSSKIRGIPGKAQKILKKPQAGFHNAWYFLENLYRHLS